jgi:thioredoxin-related protein
MKKIILSAFLMLTASLFSQNWKTNFEEAKKIAAEENKTILLVFSGSDWCAPCIKLDKKVWQSDAFKKEDDWVLYKADFPKKKANQLSEEMVAQNKKLAEKYNKEGNFPLVVVMDKNGKLVGKMGFKNVSAESYIATLKAMQK